MVWRYRNGELKLNRTHIMGVINVTPDSFFAGGRCASPSLALSRAREMEREGASVIDIGAQSTRPGSVQISEEEEWARLSPVLEVLQGQLSVPISVDTFYPRVARLALENGAAIINDVSGGLSGEMAALAAEFEAGLVMMHTGGQEGTSSPAAVRSFFEQALIVAEKQGLARSFVCLDIGVGFGKTREKDRRLIAELSQIVKGLPPVALMCAASRKRVSCANDETLPPEERLSGTLALHTVAQWNGARVLRVHDVKEAVLAARNIDLLLKGE